MNNKQAIRAKYAKIFELFGDVSNIGYIQKYEQDEIDHNMVITKRNNKRVIKYITIFIITFFGLLTLYILWTKK